MVSSFGCIDPSGAKQAAEKLQARGEFEKNVTQGLKPRSFLRALRPDLSKVRGIPPIHDEAVDGWGTQRD
jgi:hypothetical protein